LAWPSQNFELKEQSMIDNYDDACEHELTRAEALREVRRHSGSETEFLADVGDKLTYAGKEVLDWLGY
jgi:hypothetical protein